MNLELIYLGLSNIENYKNNPKIVDMNADQNYNEFKRYETTFRNYEDNKKILTNLHSMQNKLNKLLENGDVDENDANDFNYKMLAGYLEQIIIIQLKPNKSVQDIFDVFHTYNNFNDTFIQLGGDNYV